MTRSVVFTPQSLSEEVEKRLIPVGHAGFYQFEQRHGQGGAALRDFTCRVLQEPRFLVPWERMATTIVRDFLDRLTFERRFSFADAASRFTLSLSPILSPSILFPHRYL